MKRHDHFDIVVVGGASTDYLVRGQRLPGPGMTCEGRTFMHDIGGKGANQAVGAARLSARTAFIGRIGDDDRGDDVLSRLEAEDVHVDYVARDPEAPTGVAVIMVDEVGQKQIMTAPGANLKLTPQDVEEAAEILGACTVLIAQLEVPVEAVLTAAKIAKKAGARFILDPAPPHGIPEEMFALIDVIRPNSSEAEALTGIRVKDRESARAAAKMLLDRGVGAVSVQAGEEGDLIVWSEGERLLARVPVKAVDATGAGDAFVAALGVAMSEGKTITEAGPFASAAAAHKVMQLGAQAGLPRRKELIALIARTSPQLAAEEASDLAT